MAGNTSTKKAGNGITGQAVLGIQPSKSVGYSARGGSYKGQIGGHQAFAEPMQEVSAQIKGLAGTHNDIGEQSGFITDGYLDKAGIPYGEAAKFNYMPPGMDITNQHNAEIHDMPMRALTSESYPGDGWMPAPRDIPE